MILSTLDSDLQQLHALRRELNEIREITGLLMDFDVLETKIKPFFSLTQHIRRLPREIMELIFLAAKVDCRASMSICDAPLIFLRICQLRREVARTTSSLWAPLAISTPRKYLLVGIRSNSRGKP